MRQRFDRHMLQSDCVSRKHRLIRSAAQREGFVSPLVSCMYVTDPSAKENVVARIPDAQAGLGTLSDL